jgi:hypothetical protein
MKLLYEKYCKKCHQKFITSSPYKKLCLFCAIENEQKSIKKSYQRRKLEKVVK